MRNVVVAGASRGIGAAVAAHLEPRVDTLFSVSRTEAKHGTWVPADLSTPEGVACVASAAGATTKDNVPFREVAYAASKFGLRGVVHALRAELRPQRIGVTVINPGDVGTAEVLEELGPGAIDRGDAVPMEDLLAVLDCVLAVSRPTCIKEIDLPNMSAPGA